MSDAQSTENTEAGAEGAATPESGETEKHHLLKRLGPAGLLGLLWASMPAIAGFVLLGNIGSASDWLLSHEATDVAVYVAIFAISAGFGFLPTYAQAILGGWVFGAWIGLPAALAGFTGGSIVGYVITRVISQDRVEKEIADHPRAEAIRQALIGHGFWRTLGIVTLLRVPPNSPFALTNLAMASSGVRLAPYVIGTAVGMAPRTAVAVILASRAAATGARDIQEFVTEGPGLLVLLAGAALMFIVIGIIAAIANKAISHVIDAK